MRKRYLCLVLSVLMLLSIGQILAQGEDVDLTVLWFNDANESEVFMDTVADYLVSHPNVRFFVPLSMYLHY